MPLPHWREQLDRELRRRALPAGYRIRLIEELLDHHLDCQLERKDSPMSMDALVPSSIDARIGDPRTIAAQAVQVYRRNFVQRFPLLCFVAGPLIGFPIALIGAMALGVPLTEWLLSLMGIEFDSLLTDPVSVNRAFHTFAWSLRLVPFAVAAVFFVFLARRAKQDYRWSLVAVLLVTILAASFHAQVADKTSAAQGNFSIGLSFPMSGPIAYLQVAAPLAVALFAYFRRKDHSSAQLTG